jgi:hypothetical protein
MLVNFLGNTNFYRPSYLIETEVTTIIVILQAHELKLRRILCPFIFLSKGKSQKSNSSCFFTTSFLSAM